MFAGWQSVSIFFTHCTRWGLLVRGLELSFMVKS
jgi:hypothetical protein